MSNFFLFGGEILPDNKFMDALYSPADIDEYGEAKVEAARRAAYGDDLANIIYDTFVGSVKDYIAAGDAHAEKITNTIVEANKQGIELDEFSDNFQLKATQDNDALNAALLKYQNDLDDELASARWDAAKDPAILAANVASRYNPYVLPAVMFASIVPDIYNAAKMSIAEGASIAAESTAVMVGASGLPTGLKYLSTANALTRALPKSARLLGKTAEFLNDHPASISAGTALVTGLASKDSKEYFLQHPGRYLYNFFGADVAHAGKPYPSINPTSNTRNTTPNDNSGAAVVTENTPKTGSERNPFTGGESINWEGGIVFANKDTNTPTPSAPRDVTSAREGMIKPQETVKPSEPQTLNQKAFPETTPENNARVNELADRFTNEVLEARQIPSVMQGVHGTPLTYSNENLYHSPVSVEQIWETAQRMFPALPTRVQADQNTLGYFNQYTEGIRVRGFKSWSVLCHEAGHGLSKKLGWGRNIAEVEQELLEGATSIWSHGEYGNPNSPEGRATYIEEGRAAFMNEYLINPAKARDDFPKAFADFEAKLATDSELQVNVELLGQQVRRWGNDSVFQQMNSTISYADREHVPLAKKFSDALLKVETATLDELAPLRKITKDFLMDNPNTQVDQATGEIIRDADGRPMTRPKTLAFEENPANIAQRAKEGINSVVSCLMGDTGIDTPNIIQAVANKYGVALNNVTLKDALEPIRQLSLKGDDWLLSHGYTREQGYYEAFSSYALAKHELEVIDVQNTRRVEDFNNRIRETEASIRDLEQRLSQTTSSTPEGQTLADRYRQQIQDLQDRLSNTYELERISAEITRLEGEIAAETNPRTIASLEGQLEIQRQRYRHVSDTPGYREHVQLIEAGLDDYMTTMPRGDLRNIISEAEQVPEFVEALKLYHDWNENVLRLAVAGGIFREADANYFLKTYPNYVPMKRSFALEHNYGNVGGGVDSTYANITDGLHALSREGSDRSVRDPLVQSALNLQSMVSKIERNKVAQSVVRLSETEGGDRLLRLIGRDNPMYSQVSGAEQIVSVYFGGERYDYQCMTPGLYEALTISDRATQAIQLNAIESILQGAAQSLRIGATSTPAFAARNLVKDLLNATILNRDGRKTYLPVVDQALLLWDGIMAKADSRLMSEVKAEGLQYTSYIGSNKQVNFNLRDYTEGNPHHFKAVWDKITSVVEVGEQLPRLGLYKRARERGCSPMEAAYIASDGTTNFMRSGTQVKKINRYIPFFNAVIQGNNKVFRAIKDDPVGVGLTIMSYVTIPSLICWYQNHDKDWYRDMPLAKKNKNWYWDLSPQQDGSAIIAIPKNEIVGYMFGSVPERILDFAVDNDRDSGVLKKTLAETVGQTIPSGFPTALLPIIEAQANYSFFRDRPIVDMRTAKLKPKDQYNIYTSELAKGISVGLDKVGIEASPMIIDNTIYDLTGTFGYAATGAVDMMLKDNTRSSRKWTEYTSLTYTPDTASSRSTDVFRDGLDKLEEEYGSAVKASGGKRKPRASKELKGMRKANAAAKKVSQELIALEGDKSITDGDIKRQKRDALIKKRNNIYRQANKKYLGYKYIKSPE